MFTNKTHSKTFLLFLFTIAVLLQGCGAERDTPFNPTPSGSSSGRGLGTNLNIRLLNEGTTPRIPYSNNKKLVALRSFEEMRLYWDSYVDGNWDVSIVNFETGQGFLFDRGELGDCSSTLTISNVNAYDHSANTVKVVIRYKDSGESRSSSSRNSSSSADSSSSSSSSSSVSFSEPNCNIDTNDPNHPYKFYFVPSRKRLIIEEIIE